MSLPANIDRSVDRIREQVELLRGHLLGARFTGMPEKCRQELTSAVVRLGCISAECTAIKTDMGASRMAGQAEINTVAVESLELHPRSLSRQVDEEKLLASLHSANDHTLDREEGPE